jgi:hypothetical protein
VAAGGFHLQQPLLAVCLKGSDVVTVAVAVQIGDPPDVVRKVIAPGPRKRSRSNSTTNFSPALPRSRFLASALGGVELPDQPPDGGRQRLVQIDERRWRHEGGLLVEHQSGRVSALAGKRYPGSRPRLRSTAATRRPSSAPAVCSR